MITKYGNLSFEGGGISCWNSELGCRIQIESLLVALGSFAGIFFLIGFVIYLAETQNKRGKRKN